MMPPLPFLPLLFQPPRPSLGGGLFQALGEIALIMERQSRERRALRECASVRWVGSTLMGMRADGKIVYVARYGGARA